MGKIRTKEILDKEIYVDANDLIIELLIEIERCTTESEKKAYRAVIARLSSLRDSAHSK